MCKVGLWFIWGGLGSVGLYRVVLCLSNRCFFRFIQGWFTYVFFRGGLGFILGWFRDYLRLV